MKWTLTYDDDTMESAMAWANTPENSFQKDLNIAKQHLTIIKGLDIGNETAKKIVSKDDSDRVE